MLSRTIKEFLIVRLRLGSILIKVRRFLSKFTRQQKIESYLTSHSVRKLHLGSGPCVIEDWFNTDFVPRGEVVLLDARKRFPFDDSSLDYVFSEHMIEHLEYLEGINVLRECFRVLRAGGKICISTPDLNFLFELLNQEKSELQERYISWAVDKFMPHCGIYRDAFVINNFFRSWGHKFIYDFETLHDAMISAGFISVVRCEVGVSNDKNLHGLESHNLPEEFNKLETFVIEGVKPG